MIRSPDQPQNERRRDPTPAEIRQMCAEIRRGWTPTEERERRTGSGKLERCVPPVVCDPRER